MYLWLEVISIPMHTHNTFWYIVLLLATYSSLISNAFLWQVRRTFLIHKWFNRHYSFDRKICHCQKIILILIWFWKVFCTYTLLQIKNWQKSAMSLICAMHFFLFLRVYSSSCLVQIYRLASTSTSSNFYPRAKCVTLCPYKNQYTFFMIPSSYTVNVEFFASGNFRIFRAFVFFEKIIPTQI